MCLNIEAVNQVYVQLSLYPLPYAIIDETTNIFSFPLSILIFIMVQDDKISDKLIPPLEIH